MSRRTPDRNWSREYSPIRPFTEAGRGTQCPNPLPTGGVWGTKGSPTPYFTGMAQRQRAGLITPRSPDQNGLPVFFLLGGGACRPVSHSFPRIPLISPYPTHFPLPLHPSSPIFLFIAYLYSIQCPPCECRLPMTLFALPPWCGPGVPGSRGGGGAGEPMVPPGGSPGRFPRVYMRVIHSLLQRDALK